MKGGSQPWPSVSRAPRYSHTASIAASAPPPAAAACSSSWQGHEPPFSLGFGFQDGFSLVHTPSVVVSGCFMMLQGAGCRAGGWWPCLAAAVGSERRPLRRDHLGLGHLPGAGVAGRAAAAATAPPAYRHRPPCSSPRSPIEAPSSTRIHSCWNVIIRILIVLYFKIRVIWNHTRFRRIRAR
jgi:hypothetical protein